MLTRTFAIVISLGFACSMTPPATSDATPVAELACRLEDPAFGAARLRTDVEALSDGLMGRAPGAPGGRMAEALIADRFAAIGLEPAVGASYRQEFVDHLGNTTANLVGLIRGTTSEVVLIGAHHDHLGISGGKVYPGANDNASGVAAVLAMAEAAMKLGMPQRTLVFVSFGAEEDPGGFEGSSYIAVNASGFSLSDVVYMINLDMVGTYDQTHMLYAIGASLSPTAEHALRDKVTCYPELAVDLAGFGGLSDNATFCERSIPYTFFWTDDPTCYHQPCDTSDRLDYPNMSLVIRLAFDLLWERATYPASLRGERSTQLHCFDPEDVAPDPGHAHLPLHRTAGVSPKRS